MAGRLLESVRTLPHLNTSERAKRLGLGAGAAQAFLRDRNLSKLNARLAYAGYQVEVCKPLQVARNRRLVAARPGCLTHVDYKLFGFLRGVHGEPSIRLGGFVLIDSLTSFAAVKLAKAGDQFEAVDAFQYYIERAPFEITGLMLADNARTFLSDHFINAVTKAGILLRTIRPSHPWSNGKVEAMNRTLKYQCFGAIAGNVTSWDTAALLVDKWMEYYNNIRAHGGTANKGLPPVPFYQLWCKTPGDDMAKLVNLGILKCDADWDVRLMGSHVDADGRDHQGLPFAFVMEKSELPGLRPALGLPVGGDPAKFHGAPPSNIVLAR
jgi:hypothetical protein